LEEVSCDACKAASWTLRTLLGNEVSRFLLTGIAKVLCIPITVFFLDYDPVICPGTIDQQFRDAILPVIVDDILSE